MITYWKRSATQKSQCIPQNVRCLSSVENTAFVSSRREGLHIKITFDSKRIQVPESQSLKFTQADSLSPSCWNSLYIHYIHNMVPDGTFYGDTLEEDDLITAIEW